MFVISNCIRIKGEVSLELNWFYLPCNPTSRFFSSDHSNAISLSVRYCSHVECFKHDVCFVIVCSSSSLLLVSWENCVS